MTDYRWALLESWHPIRDWDADDLVTFCGRHIPPNAEIRDTLGAEKSCEPCLRIVARESDVTVEVQGTGESETA